MLVADGPLTWPGVLVGWQTSPVSVAGLLVESLLAATYLYAAGRVGRRWRPAQRTRFVLAGAVGSGVLLVATEGVTGFGELTVLMLTPRRAVPSQRRPAAVARAEVS